MSAKSVQGPNGKKPASVATNLIGKATFTPRRDFIWKLTGSKLVVALE